MLLSISHNLVLPFDIQFTLDLVKDKVYISVYSTAFQILMCLGLPWGV